MNINISLYRARVGGFSSTAHRLSLKTFYAKDMGNALAFLLLFCYGKRYLTLSLFFHFSCYLINAPCTYTTEDYAYTKQAPYKASGSQRLSSTITTITLVLLILMIYSLKEDGILINNWKKIDDVNKDMIFLSIATWPTSASGFGLLSLPPDLDLPDSPITHTFSHQTRKSTEIQKNISLSREFFHF